MTAFFITGAIADFSPRISDVLVPLSRPHPGPHHYQKLFHPEIHKPGHHLPDCFLRPLQLSLSDSKVRFLGLGQHLQTPDHCSPFSITPLAFQPLPLSQDTTAYHSARSRECPQLAHLFPRPPHHPGCNQYSCLATPDLLALWQRSQSTAHTGATENSRSPTQPSPLCCPRAFYILLLRSLSSHHSSHFKHSLFFYFDYRKFTFIDNKTTSKMYVYVPLAGFSDYQLTSISFPLHSVQFPLHWVILRPVPDTLRFHQHTLVATLVHVPISFSKTQGSLWRDDTHTVKIQLTWPCPLPFLLSRVHPFIYSLNLGPQEGLELMGFPLHIVILPWEVFF